MFEQLPLPLPFKPALGRADFLVAPCNAAAVATLESPEVWPNRVAILVGPAGSGKSHLAAVWQHMVGADLIQSQDLTTAIVAERNAHNAGSVVLENCDGQIHEDAVFHLINDARDREFSILLTAKQAPAYWSAVLPDLKSRLAAAARADIQAPDDIVLSAVLVKQLADRGLSISPRVLSYVMPRIERSFEAVRALVMTIDTQTLAQKRPLTIPLVKQIMSDSSL